MHIYKTYNCAFLCIFYLITYFYVCSIIANFTKYNVLNTINGMTSI